MSGAEDTDAEMWASERRVSARWKSEMWQERCGKRDVAREMWQERCGKRDVVREMWQERCGKERCVKE